jgi:ABC-type glycerol-3-phosphate transport system substrate-binding protein
VRIHGRATALTTAVLATAMLTMAVAACGSSGSSGASGKAITITYWSSSTQAEINYLDSHFNAAHSKVKVSGQYIASADDTTAKEVSAIKTGTEPNVVIGQDPSALPLLAESGKVVNLSQPLAAETAALYPGIKPALFYKGQELGMALGGVGDYALFYNKKDFAKAGIAGPPTTWAQLESDASKLSDPAKHHYGIYIPWGDSEWISYEWEGLLWSNGGQFLNPGGTKVAFDSPAGVQALTTWVNLVRKDHAAPTTSFAQGGSYDGAPAFASDAVSMIIDGQYALSEFNTAKLSYGVALVPAGTSGQSGTNIGIGVASVFDHGTAANNAAITFVQWLAQPAQGAYLTAVSSGLPSAPAQLSQAAVQHEAASQPTYQVFAQQLKTGHTRPTVPAYTTVSLDLATEINDALNGSVTPAQALAKAASEGNQAIASGTGS